MKTKRTAVVVASATDRAGNTATRSLSFSMDTAPRLPLNLAARLEDGAGADLSWSRPGADVLAYRVYKDGSRVSASLHTPTTFRDTAYTADALHVYEITAVDQLGQEGPRAKITIPPVGLSLAGYGLVLNGQEALTRGFNDALRLGFANRDGQTRLLGPSALELSAGGQVYAAAQAAALSVGAGANVESSAIVGVSPSLPASALLKASVNLPSEAGTTAVLVKSFTLAVREPVAPVVEVFTGALIRGALSQVRVKLNNRGSAPFEVRTAVVEGFAPSPAGEVIASLKTLEGTILSQAGLVQTTGAGLTARVESGKLTYFAAVEPGTSFLFDAVEVEVPVSAGASLTISGRVKTFTGTQSQAAVAAPAYTATVAAAQAVYDQGVQVVLAGEARDQAQALLAGATVQVRITSKGYTRTLTTLTSPSGAYSVTFNPLPNEAGVYNLSASAPESVSNAAQASFTIVGFGFSPTTLTARLSQSSSLALNVNLANTGESAVSGLTLQVEGAPAGLNVVVGGAPSTLLPGVQGPLSLRLETPTAAVGQFTPVLVARDSNGFERRMPITVDVIGSQPIPRVTPQSFQVGMLAGEVRRQVILLENIGFSSWENVTLSAPTLPWVKIAGTGDMGSIPAGGNASFGISFEPPADLPTGQFVQNPIIEVRSANNVMIPINVGITVTSAKQGNLAFTLVNADRPRDALGKGVPVPGADVTLTSLDIVGLTFNVKADANGVATFTGVPSGQYNWRAQATNFSPSSGVDTVESGLTKELEVIMPTAMVSYEWGVTETVIKDKYDVTLGITFKTDVLAPALVVEPTFIEVPIDAGQSMLTQYTITNRGLVSAFNVNVRPALKDPAVLLETPVTSIPELKAGQTVVVPVKVTLLHASPCHYNDMEQDAQYRCVLGTEVEFKLASVIFKVGRSIDCETGVGGLTAQAVSFITGSAPTPTCQCGVKIGGKDPATADFISINEPKNYRVDVSYTPNCTCKPSCEAATIWTADGGLRFIGGNTGCNVAVTSINGQGGNLGVTKGGLFTCTPDSRTLKPQPSTVTYQAVAACSGFDDSITPHWLMVPNEGPNGNTNTALAKIIPIGAASQITFEASAGITVARTNATSSPDKLTVAGLLKTDVTINARSTALAPIDETLKIAVRNTFTKNIVIHAITEERDDIQVVPPGQVSLTGDCILPGPNGVLDTNPDPRDVEVAVSNKIVTGADGICDTTASKNLVPLDVPSKEALASYLNQVWGKQANIFFTVERNDVIVNYDEDRSGVLADPEESALGSIEIDAITRKAKLEGVFNIYFVNRMEVGKAFTRKTSGETWAADNHTESAVNLIAHEVGHLLGIPAITGGSTNPVDVMSAGDASNPCEVRHHELEVVNP